MRTVLVGIARMGSTRFPGKILANLGGKTVLGWVIEAAHKYCTKIDDWVIATTTNPEDDVIEEIVGKHRIYRGSEDDVLERFYQAAISRRADIAVRVTCDCPFIDPHVIDQVVALRDATGAAYASNIDPPTWPDGLDCEAIFTGTLSLATRYATSEIDRSCVTSWIYHNRHEFYCETLTCPLPKMHKERWVLDTQDDYKFCKEVVRIWKENGNGNDRPNWLQIKDILDKNPELRKINAHHPRNERYFAALAQEPLQPRSYETSKQLLTRAKKTIPLGAQTFSKSEIQYPSESPLFVTHGDGGYCFDVDGNRYVDLVGGLLPVILGHRDPDVDYAVRRQMNAGNCFSLSTELEAQLAETLCRLIPCAEWARFGKNGSDVTSAAVRLARAHTGRSLVLSAGYHGWHDWAVANDDIRNKGVSKLVAVDTIPLGNQHFLDIVKKWGKGIATVIVEPETNPEFLKECRKFCDEIGALLIFDEIITGFRFDLGGAQKLYGVTPDIACFGKSMANGYPISAIVGKQEYYKTMEQISYSGTFFGDPLGLAAAIATIEKLEREDVLPKIWFNQGALLGGIDNLPDFVVSFEGHLPGLPRLKFINNDVKTLFIQEMAQQGVLVIASHNLMYAHGENEIKRVITAYQHVLPLLAEAVESGKVKQLIKGRSIAAHANIRATT